MAETFRAGQTFTRQFSSPNNGSQFSGQFIMALVSGGPSMTIEAIREDGGFSIIQTFTGTKAWQPGEYRWFFQVSDGVSKFIEQEGLLNVLASIDTVLQDSRSHNQKVLASLEALLEGKALDDVNNFSIAGRELNKMPIQDLLHWKSRYMEYVRRENAKNLRRQGKRTSSRIVSRFI